MSLEDDIDDPTCAICEQSVNVRDEAEWEQGKSLCDVCAQARVVELEQKLAAAPAWRAREDEICRDVVAAIVPWINDPARKPPDLAFTSGLERTIATLIADAKLASRPAPAWHPAAEVTKPGDYFIWRHKRDGIEEDEPIRAITIKLPYTIGGRPTEISKFWAGWMFYGPIPRMASDIASPKPPAKQ